MGETQNPSSPPEIQKRIAGLYVHMAKKLGIQQAPRIILSQNKENAAKPFGKTAFYQPQDRYIKVYVTERHPTDILRSFAHELIHHWQNEHGVLTHQESQEHYAQKDPNLRLREMEAYLIGNILFRDWQDENRYGSLNENFQISDPDKVRRVFRLALLNLIKDNAINAKYHVTAAGEMDPKDFVEELTRKLELEVDKFLQVVNSGRENQQLKLNESEVRELIRERIVEMGKKIHRFSKDDDEEDMRVGAEDLPQSRNQLYSQWLKDMLKKKKEQAKKAQKYYTIGFSPPDSNHFCWYWNATTKSIVAARGGAHMEHFGKKIPYESFRGRYDLGTKELSLTVPEVGAMTITGDIKKDVPHELLKSLDKVFHHPKIFYFPFLV